MADLHVIQNDAGDYFVGFDADGTFVSIASVPASRVVQLQERAASLAELAKADDAENIKRHAEAASSLPYTVKSKSTKGGSS